MPFKISITLESELSSQELADFFGALAKAEAGNVIPLMKVLQVPSSPDASTLPIPTAADFERDSLHEEELAQPVEVVPVQPAKPQPVPEPAYSQQIVKNLSKSHLDVKELNKIINRHGWARGLRASTEYKWGVSKAAALARIGQQFQDWSLMDGSVKTEEQLLNWCKERGFQGTL